MPMRMTSRERKALVLARVQELSQILPADQLHREEVGLAVLPEVVDADDVGVLEAEHHLRFGEEALDDVLGTAGGEGLEGVLAAAGGVADVVDDAHAALAEQPEDLVAGGDLHGALASSGSTRNSTTVQLSGPPPSLVRVMIVSQMASRSSPPAATIAASSVGREHAVHAVGAEQVRVAGLDRRASRRSTSTVGATPIARVSTLS